jgi:polysaccharide deacetylase 2 family uncharacterized protein YibQ
MIYLPLAGCILLSNFPLPNSVIPAVSYQATPFLSGGAKPPSLLNFTEFNQERTRSSMRLTKTPAVSQKAIVAIIIDDVGYNLSIIREIAKIPIPLTWAFLPFTPYTKESLKIAQNHDFTIMLHLPLEPLDRKHNPGPGVIRDNWSEAEIEAQLNKNLEAIPGAIGLNNHMGSFGTQDPHLMACLMRIIKKKGMFFIDSVTSSKSVAEKYAMQYQVPFAKRNVFIDNDDDTGSKKAALQELIKIALKDGSAIGIAHVKDGNAEIITEMLPDFTKAGIEFVPVSELPVIRTITNN